MTNTEFLHTIISQSNYPIYDKFVVFLTSMSISILIDGIFANLIQKLQENRIINKYEKLNKQQKYEYYRDVLQTKSPAMLSYCYNRKLNIEDDIVAILLNLYNKKNIELKENEIILGNIDNLKQHEKYFLRNIYKIKDKDFKKSFKEVLLNDLEDDGYVFTKDDNNLHFDTIMGAFIIWMIIYIIVSIPIFMQFSSIGIMLFLAYFLTFVGVPLFKQIEKKINPAIRTEKALELSGKLKGLKRYIVDYSIIGDNSLENINLYDEYVIYAIIFNIKGKLNRESKQLYNNIKNMII